MCPARLSDLRTHFAAKGIASEIEGSDTVAVSGVAYDSRKVSGGDLYCAVRGERTDGHLFVDDALKAGAVALLVEEFVSTSTPQIRVSDSRLAMGHAAAAVYGFPSERLTLVGVTGTNGKTSTAYLLESIMSAAGRKTALTGTVETRICGNPEPVVMTTPESPDLQRLLRRMVDSGVDTAVMEVSSHALALERVAGTEFAVGVFTNLTQDHLDFHKSMEDYFEAKLKLFTENRCERGVFNLDDVYSARAMEIAGLPALTFSISGRRADVTGTEVVPAMDGTDFVLTFEGKRYRVRLRLRGRFAVANATAAAAAALHLEVSPELIRDGLESLESVPGRFEPVERGQDFAAVVDYAHTPDSVASVLAAAREVGKGRVLVVVGCGGDRDRSKRPLMAKAAVEGADVAIFTSDNPRSENPADILKDMTRDLVRDDFTVEADRRKAIRLAVEEAKAGDVLVVAGKGHETGQLARGKVTDFDDRVVLAEEIDRLLGGVPE